MKKYISIRMLPTNINLVSISKKKKRRGMLNQLMHDLRKERMDRFYLVNPEKQRENLIYLHPDLQKLNLQPFKVENSEELQKDIRTFLVNVEDKVKKDYKEAKGKKIPSSTKFHSAGLITFSNTMQEDLEKYGKETLFEVTKDFLFKTFGKDNITSITLHLDETTPHFHFTTTNYLFKEHKTITTLISQRNFGEKLQDMLANHYQQNIKDFDYNRGERSSVKNVTKDFHKEKTRLSNFLKEQEAKIKKFDYLLEQKQKELKDLKTNVTTQETKLKRLEEASLISKQRQERYEQLENRLNSLENDRKERLTEIKELKEIKEKLEKEATEAFNLYKKLDKKNTELEKVNTELEEKNTKLEEEKNTLLTELENIKNSIEYGRTFKTRFNKFVNNFDEEKVERYKGAITNFLEFIHSSKMENKMVENKLGLLLRYINSNNMDKVNNLLTKVTTELEEQKIKKTTKNYTPGRW